MARLGIILAGGAGTRLHPMTQVVVKQLLPVYDKPMIYYPLSTLMLAGLRDILIISTPEDAPAFARIFGDGSRLGLNLSFSVQPRPEGIAQALLIGRDAIGADGVCLILGDNLFYGAGLEAELAAANAHTAGATVFAAHVQQPERYGVIRFDTAGQPAEIIEKPEKPASNYAVTGLYFYDQSAVEIAAALAPSPRGELEITDVNRAYLARGALACRLLGRGFAWLDAGTPDSLLEAAAFVQTLERRQGLRIACPEEIAARKGWISPEALLAQAHPFAKSDYGRYLIRVAAELGAT
jgi:glucose-1-phosphate thymidylyltransferase